MNNLSIEELKEMYANILPTGMSKYSRAIAELIAIRELKGEREPVAITDDMAMAFHSATNDSALGRDDMEEIKAGLQAVQELFTAPQNPVVKLAGDMPRGSFNYGMFAKGWNDRGLADKLAIEAAGGIVKDGDQ